MFFGSLERPGRPADAAWACVVAGCLVGWPFNPLMADPEMAPPGVTELQPPLEPFTPAQPRSPAEQRRLEALALFATARSAQQQEQFESALRLYQRALRRDPKSATIARAIVPLAFQLKRPAVAVRYALHAAELEKADPLLLRRLGVYLTEQGDWEQAVRLFERALDTRDSQRETAADVLLHMELGRLYHLIDRHEMAANHFAKVLHALANPKDFALDGETTKTVLGDPASTYSLIADCFLLANRSKEAMAAYQEAEKASPRPGRLQVNRARVLLHDGQPEKAFQALEAAFEHDLSGDDATPFLALIDVLGRLGRSDEILPRLEALLEKQENHPALRQTLADHYREAGKLDDAASHYEELRKRSPTLAGFRGLTEVYRRAGKVEPLLQVLGELADKTGALDALGPEGKEIAENKELLGKLIDLARKRKQAPEANLDHGAALAVAILALEGGQFDAAGEFFEAAVASRPERAAELLILWGMGLMLSDKPALAVDVFRRAISGNEHPRINPLFNFYLAGALELDGRTDEALAAARKAVELEPDSPRFHGRIGWVLHHAGRHKEAIDAYRRTVERFDRDYSSPDTRDALRQSRLVLSSLHVLEGDLVQAEPWLEEILDEFPGDPGAMNDLGYLWADQGENLDLALEMIEQAVAAQPENAAFRDSLGWVYYRLGRHEEAVVELEKAAGLDEEPDPTILDHLGDAYLKTNRTEDARKAWQRAVEAFREAGESEKANAVEGKLSPKK